jgi:glucose/arabinose dehydrogenase
VKSSWHRSKLHCVRVRPASNSNITENGMAVEEGRAAIYEVDRLTGAKRIFASGTRNPTGVACAP